MERIYLRRYKSGKDARAGEERKCKQMIENYGEAKVRGSNRTSKFTDWQKKSDIKNKLIVGTLTLCTVIPTKYVAKKTVWSK